MNPATRRLSNSLYIPTLLSGGCLGVCLLALSCSKAPLDPIGSNMGSGGQNEGIWGNPNAVNPEPEPNEDEGVNDSSSPKGKSSSKKKKPKDKDKDNENDDPGNDDPGSDGAKFDLGIIPDADLMEKPCAIDFLFVIDNSASMEDEQNNLASSVPEFIETVQNEIEDLESYQIGVVVTDDNRENAPGCKERGALVTKTGGKGSSNRICGPYEDGKHFMTDEDDLSDAFACAAKPGVGGKPDEKPIDSLREAFSPSMLKAGGCNEDFLREEALLVVTVITDEEDDKELGGFTGSKGDPQDWYDDLVAIKGDPRKIVVLGLIGTEDGICDPLVDPHEEVGFTGAQLSLRLKEFVEKFNKRGVVGDVCAPNYDPFFEEAVSVIDFACSEFPQG